MSKVTRYENVIMAHVQRYSDSKMIYLVIPDVKVLTDKRRAAITAELFPISGRILNLDYSPFSTLVQWSRHRMGRYAWLEVIENSDGTVSYNSPASGGGNYVLGETFIIKSLDDLTALTDATKGD